MTGITGTDFNTTLLNITIINVVAAYLLDLLIGDPRWLTHPVVIIGKLISWLEAVFFRLCKSPAALRLAGLLLAVTVVAAAYSVTRLIVGACTGINSLLGQAVEIWLLSTTLAAKSLAGAGREIYRLLLDGNLQEARVKVGWIVGRDTAKLDQSGVTRATVETVAENIVDGVLSPLFYAFLGGAPLAMAYKAVNTLDSMVGYKNEKYLHLGWASARLDDLANFLPARWAGALLLSASALLGYNSGQAYHTIKTYAAGHPSPNSGIPESAVAGALGVRLGGLNSYHGQVSLRAYMGEELVPLEAKHIAETIKLMYAASALGVLSGAVLLTVFTKIYSL
jgi:adenosylcobinamide-phosphate synthase